MTHRGFVTLDGNALYGTTNNENEQMRISGLRWNSTDKHQKEQYQECAKRVLFYSCFSKCDLDDKPIRHFDSNWYYNMKEEQDCVQTCYNAKMMLHFGDA